MAVISVGENSSHDHPADEVLRHLAAIGARVLRTDEMGDVEVVTDGEKMWVE